MNLLIASGNLGSDAEVKHTPNDKAVTTFSIAVNSGWGDRQKTTWVRCDYWGDRGEKVAPYLLKGIRPTVTGEIYLDEYDGKQYLKMNVRDVELPPKPKGDSTPTAKAAEPVFEDDLPF